MHAKRTNLQSESSTMAMMFMGVYASSSRSTNSMLSVVLSTDFVVGDMECIASSTTSCLANDSYSALHLASHIDVAPHAAK